LGDFETRAYYECDEWHSTYKKIVMSVHDSDDCSDEHGCGHSLTHRQSKKINDDVRVDPVPSPSFQELLRLMMKIGRRLLWSRGKYMKNRATTKRYIGEIAALWAFAKSEPEAIKAVEDYLTPLLK
jgi:hypothetical protein